MSVYVSLSMHPLILLLISLTCASCGHCVQVSTDRWRSSSAAKDQDAGNLESLKALAMLLISNRVAAFHASHPAARFLLDNSRVSRLRPLLCDRRNRMGCRIPVMSDDVAVAERSPTYVTTPIFYVNDVPHVGHAYTSVAADAIARFGRLDGQPTWFATGTDEHGEKVQQSAEKKGIKPQTFCDEVSLSFQKMREPFDLSNDVFVRTTNAEHKSAVVNMWNRLQDAGLIYKGVYEGWYSVSDECFYTESELTKVDGAWRDPSGKPVEWRAKEPSYFFKLSQFTQKLLDYYEANPDFIQPASRRNEVLAFIRDAPDGLNDLSISRTSFSWGISVPGDDEHIVYVWIDALTNYLTVLGWPESEATDGADGLYQKFWPHAVHIVGKDILRFHAVYWPAMLMGANLPLPKMIFAHGWWTKDGQKISKSLGNAIDPFELVETYGTDGTRFFLLGAATFGSDADFSRREMLATINGFLANSLGNLLNRGINLAYKNCEKAAPPRPEPDSLTESDKKMLDLAYELPPKLQNCFDKLNLWGACRTLEELIRTANVYIDEEAPWVVAKTDMARFRTVIWVILEILRIAAVGFAPIIPASSKKMLTLLGVDEAIAASPRLSMITDDKFVIDGNPLPKPEIVFPRKDEAEIEAAEAEKAAAKAAAEPKKVLDAAALEKLVEDIKAAGNDVRDGKKAGKTKEELTPLIDKLLAAKAQYQEATGEPYDPAAKPKKEIDAAALEKLVEAIKDAGNVVREAKEAGKSKDELTPLIDKLLAAKAQYQEATGEPYDPPKKKKKGK